MRLGIYLIAFLLFGNLYAQVAVNNNFENWPTSCAINQPPTGWTTFTTWTTTDPDEAGCNGQVVPFSGNAHMNLVWSTGSNVFSEGAEQLISGFSPGTQYSITFWAIHNQGLWASTGKSVCDVYIDSVLVYTTPEMTNGGAWALNTVTFTATATSHLLGFRTEKGPTATLSSGSVGIDSLLISSSCAPTFDTISPSTCDTFVSPSGLILSATGTYQDTIQNNGGCDSVITINLTVVDIDTGITSNGNVLTSTDSNGTWQWINCDNGMPIQGETSSTFTPTESGIYAVVISNGPCMDTSACVHVTITSRSRSDFDFNVYPNPTSGRVFIESNEKLSIRLMNTYGQILFKVDESLERRAAVDLSDQPGIYFIELRNEDGRTKLIKVIRE